MPEEAAQVRADHDRAGQGGDAQGGGDRELVVEFAAGANGVTVSETFDAEETHPVELQRAGWQAILDRFARHVERGRSVVA